MQVQINDQISFQERSLRAKEVRSQQPATTLQEALKQVQRLKETSRAAMYMKEHSMRFYIS
jgi:hypothetical protein